MAEVTLAEVKQHLRITDTADDALLTSQLDAAEAYLVEIGVAIATPIAAPVRQAVLLIIEGFYKGTLAGHAVRSNSVEGIGGKQFWSPDLLDAARLKTVDRLIRPYRTETL